MAVYTMTLQEILENNVDIFNFDYPIFEEEYRKVLERKIINHYYFYEIGCETVSRFIFNLNEKMNLIMPFYNKLYMSQGLEQRIMDNYDVTETYERIISNTNNSTVNNTNNSTVNNTNKSIVNDNSKNKDLSLHSDTPNKRIDISTNDYVTNIDKITGERISENQAQQNSDTQARQNSDTQTQQNSDTSEKWERRMHGNIGIQTDADSIVKYEKSLKNVDVLVIGELAELFMQIW